jgi:hypothetical protein
MSDGSRLGSHKSDMTTMRQGGLRERLDERIGLKSLVEMAPVIKDG